MPAAPEPSRKTAALGVLLGALGSLLAHAFVFLGLHWAGTMPAIDFELARPSEVEFGVTDPDPAPEPAAAPPAAMPQAAPEAAVVARPAPKQRKPKPKPVAADAGTPDVAAEAVEKPPGPDPTTAGERPLLSAFAPEGAQIALRLHMARVRDSELAPDVRGLLEAVADFRLLLEGSGLDPLTDLERLYVASPDLRRANLVIAGQYAGGEEVAERAVANLASARGLPATWRKHGPMRVAPWHDLDETERVLALIAPHQFAITRSEDLTRVLQVARALARRRSKDTPEPGEPEDVGAALLALAPDETLALSVEGVRLFARGNLRGVPERLEASVRTLPDGTLDVRVTGHFENPEAAERAQAYWDRNRARFADHPVVAFIGMRAPLADAVIRAEDTLVEARTRVTLQQARVVLGFIRNALTPPPSDSPRVSPGPTLAPLPGAARNKPATQVAPREPATGDEPATQAGPDPLSRPSP